MTDSTESPRIRCARRLRQDAGYAEKRVWEMVRGGRIDGLKFRRQHPIGPYTVDFACDQLRLVLEIDGRVHELDDVAKRDADRQGALEALGWTVQRFGNDQALGEPRLIVDAVRNHAKSVRGDPHPPTDCVGGPLPLPNGEGAWGRLPRARLPVLRP